GTSSWLASGARTGPITAFLLGMSALSVRGSGQRRRAPGRIDPGPLVRLVSAQRLMANGPTRGPVAIPKLERGTHRRNTSASDPQGAVPGGRRDDGSMAIVPDDMEVDRRLPPGQYVTRGRPVVHYGRVPAFRPERWNLMVFGATASGTESRLTWPEFCALPRVTVVADFHCVTRFSVLDNVWSGVAATTLLELVPPAP